MSFTSTDTYICLRTRDFGFKFLALGCPEKDFKSFAYLKNQEERIK